MNNGIRLNNFENGLNDFFRSKISISKNDINVYKDLFNLEFNSIFNIDTILKDDFIIKGNDFKNIIDRINIVIKKRNNNLKSFYCYDLNFNNTEQLNEQNSNFNLIMNEYLSLFTEFNKSAKIKRQIFMEIEIYVYDELKNKKYHLLDFIKLLINSKEINYDNIIYSLQQETINQINKLIINYGGYSFAKIQNWLPIIAPDKYCYNNDNTLNKETVDVYCDIIKSIKKIQNKLFSYSFNLGGPNAISFNLEDNNDNNFLNYIFKSLNNDNKLKNIFDYYTFYFDEENNEVYKDNKFNIDNIENINNIFSLDLETKNIFFTNQGIYLNPNINDTDINYKKLKSLGYDEINNELLLYKKNIFTFKNKLISFDEDTSGLIYVNSYDKIITIKDAYYLYKRINNLSINFNLLQKDVIIGNSSYNYNQITLYDDESKTDTIYILWSNEEYSNIVLESNYVRKYYQLNKYTNGEIDYINSKNNIINVNLDLTILFEHDDNFLIIIDDNILSKQNLADLQNKVKSIVNYYQQTIEHLINVLPGSYNKEIIETNFYKLLRAAALELSETKITLDEIKNGFYLNALDKTENYLKEAKEDYIYKNFGVLIDLPKKAKWSYEQYRQMVTAVIKVLLDGPTKENIETAIEQFTGYKNKIFELYKEKDNIMFCDLEGLNLTYRFAVQIMKDINKYDDSEELMENLIYLLNIIKPAQTLFLIYFVLCENEIVDIVNNIKDIIKSLSITTLKETKFGIDLQNTFELYNRNNRNILVGNREFNNYNKLGAPFYKIQDVLYDLNIINDKEHFELKNIKNNILNKYDFYDKYSIKYLYDENGKVILNEYGLPIEIQSENNMTMSYMNFSDDFLKKITLSKNKLKKISTTYKQEIYFNENDLIYDVSYKENIKVFLNGVLITYNNYDYIKLDNYAIGIKFNNNIYDFQDNDIITILYLKIGTSNNVKYKKDEMYNLNIINNKEYDFFVKKDGFRLVGNLPIEKFYGLNSGMLNNLKYITLGTLQDRNTVELIISKDRQFTETELPYIELMKNNGVIVKRY